MKGFTLIEVTIVMAILLILMGPVFLEEQKMRAATYTLIARRDAHEEARAVMARFERDLKSPGVKLSSALDGYSVGSTRCGLRGGQVLRGGHALNNSFTADDLVVYQDATRYVVSLSGHAAGERWTLVSRITPGGRP